MFPFSKISRKFFFTVQQLSALLVFTPGLFFFFFWKAFRSLSLRSDSQTNVETRLFYLTVVFIIALYAEDNVGYIGCII